MLSPSMPKLAPASPAGKPAETGRRQDRRTPRRKFHLRKSCLANGANLMYEGARVKSWMLGRDLNPGGRGYGDFFPHGMFQIGNLRPQASVTPTLGYGNSINNLCCPGKNEDPTQPPPPPPCAPGYCHGMEGCNCCASCDGDPADKCCCSCETAKSKSDPYFAPGCILLGNVGFCPYVPFVFADDHCKRLKERTDMAYIAEFCAYQRSIAACYGYYCPWDDPSTGWACCNEYCTSVGFGGGGTGPGGSGGGGGAFPCCGDHRLVPVGLGGRIMGAWDPPTYPIDPSCTPKQAAAIRDAMELLLTCASTSGNEDVLLFRACLQKLGSIPIRCEISGNSCCVGAVTKVCQNCNVSRRTKPLSLACSRRWYGSNCKTGTAGPYEPHVLICKTTWDGPLGAYSNAGCNFLDSLVHEILHLCDYRHKIKSDPPSYKGNYELAFNVVTACFCQCR